MAQPMFIVASTCSSAPNPIPLHGCHSHSDLRTNSVFGEFLSRKERAISRKERAISAEFLRVGRRSPD
jgi:hypothetical protein